MASVTDRTARSQHATTDGPTPPRVRNTRATHTYTRAGAIHPEPPLNGRTRWFYLVGDIVQAGQQIAAVGNNGHSSAPHLHFQVQDSPASSNAERTCAMRFRNVYITRSGPWPWGSTRELRTGDLVRSRG